jgi:hypothetical protein
MGCLKGVVIEVLHSLVKVRLETGKHFLTTPPHPLKINARVSVGWDMTHNQPTKIITESDLEIKEIKGEYMPTEINYTDGVVDEEVSNVFSTTECPKVIDVNDV